MSTKIQIDLKGFKGVSKKFNRLASRKIQNQLLNPALKDGAKVILTESKSLAPVLSGKLRDTLKVKKGPRSRKSISWFVQTGTRTRLQIPESDAAYYPAAVEFGTKNAVARPYMRPALENASEEALNAVGKTLGQKIKESARKK